VVWHELAYGVHLSQHPLRERSRIESALARVRRIELDAQDAEAAAMLRAKLRRSGQEIGAYDSLIAGQALAKGWTLVTANTREFARVEGLSVVDWTRPEEQ
jgi:tRNA(fMet)-specific endonuclease VapC